MYCICKIIYRTHIHTIHSKLFQIFSIIIFTRVTFSFPIHFNYILYYYYIVAIVRKPPICIFLVNSKHFIVCRIES